ncbi:mRNA-capping enzyme [Madurella mycetomatis]|uniref:mRNA-capping enzyme n=1 Tax=Madurella mycetomatis TaxID=100816 RepID=A0A175VVI1_9PEZI|nr:mRNA-capping enzyme [Madurella mycetomatis]
MIVHSSLSWGDALRPVLVAAAASAAWYLLRMASSKYDAKATDPPLLERSSSIKSYTTSRATYPKLRVFYRRHQHAECLPLSPAPIPLLVFVHGLGGSVAQFNALLTSLTPIASCLAVDLPGCGVSEFEPREWDAYSTDALVELLETVIEDHRDARAGQGVVLIGHSMGASLAALLANPRVPPKTDLSKYVLGLVAICPMAGEFKEDRVALFRKLLYIPEFLFDLWRAWDRRGGPESPSVRRFLGPDADAESKRLQHMYNCQSRTPVWRRMAWGALPEYRNGMPQGGMPTIDVWSGLHLPVYLVGGECDTVLPPEEVDKIVSSLAEDRIEPNPKGNGVATPTDSTAAANGDASGIPPLPLHPRKLVMGIKLPKPAGHGLLFTPPTAPILAGLISDFLASHVTGRLSLGWQLQYLCRDGKWDVKNLEKWQNVTPVSEPIGGVFRAIKTLREDVIDISHDNPVYNPQGLEEGGIHYHKFPTLSKVPPGDAEIRGFIDLVDKIRDSQKQQAEARGWDDGYVVGVHCHYGFNRTGFLIACYLVERCGFSAKQAIEEFARARPNGIKHEHFKDRLHVRYSGVKSET